MTNSSVKDIDLYIREAFPRLENLIEAVSAKIIKEISDEIKMSAGIFCNLECIPDFVSKGK